MAFIIWKSTRKSEMKSIFFDSLFDKARVIFYNFFIYNKILKIKSGKNFISIFWNPDYPLSLLFSTRRNHRI